MKGVLADDGARPRERVIVEWGMGFDDRKFLGEEGDVDLFFNGNSRW